MCITKCLRDTSDTVNKKNGNVIFFTLQNKNEWIDSTKPTKMNIQQHTNATHLTFSFDPPPPHFHR